MIQKSNPGELTTIEVAALAFEVLLSAEQVLTVLSLLEFLGEAGVL